MTTDINALTSTDATSPAAREMVAVRDLRPGDQIRHAAGLAGQVTIARITPELNADLTPWWAVRTTGGRVLPVDSLDTLIPRTQRHDRTTTAEQQEDTGPFVPPPRMRGLLDLADQHRRNYRLDHFPGEGYSEPHITLHIYWRPDGAYEPTIITTTWHPHPSGVHRMRHAQIRGHLCHHQPISYRRATDHITGRTCLLQDRP
ncbi:hypothetical protein IU469_30850 [Nocardia puris]|uniref:hypothetical protein n=1 Tax=Nocardia puris TaxID=208602 RepID=UPI001894CB9A|nr:hypothetical protein [Nocardia puris]MBF6213144.1 hypothetical protein [Nocardia puris]MBF6370073.1 hypothetical protein [Nocardia puris]